MCLFWGLYSLQFLSDSHDKKESHSKVTGRLNVTRLSCSVGVRILSGNGHTSDLSSRCALLQGLTAKHEE